MTKHVPNKALPSFAARPPRIVIVGAGALGSALGGTLALHGADVWLVTRNAAHRQAMADHGLFLVSAQDETVARPGVAASCKEIAGAPADIVIILCKSANTAEAAHDALSVAGPETTILSLQNGMGHEHVLADIFGAKRVIGGKTYAGGVMLAPGRVQASVAGKDTIIGEISQTDPLNDPMRSATIAAQLTGYGMPCKASPNMVGAIWDKLLINVATGALTALTRMTYGEICADPALACVALSAVAEAMEVAKARSVTLSITSPEQAWAMARAGLPDSFRTSMLQTLEKGQRSEVDFINGAVVREGEQVGIATPVNRLLTACIHGVETSRAFAIIDCSGRQRV